MRAKWAAPLPGPQFPCGVTRWVGVLVCGRVSLPSVPGYLFWAGWSPTWAQLGRGASGQQGP